MNSGNFLIKVYQAERQAKSALDRNPEKEAHTGQQPIEK